MAATRCRRRESSPKCEGSFLRNPNSPASNNGKASRASTSKSHRTQNLNDDEIYEVTLQIDVTATANEQTAFKCELL